MKFEIGTKVTVENLNELTAEEWELTEEEYFKMIEYEEKEATIISISCDVDKNSAYYNIEFEDGYVIEAISDYHLW